MPSPIPTTTTTTNNNLHNIPRLRGPDIATFTPKQIRDWIADTLELPHHAEIFYHWKVDGPTIL